MTGHRTTIASHLPEPLNARIAAALPDVEIIAVKLGAAALPPAATGLIASPYGADGDRLPPQPPEGWDRIGWVQFSSVGTDAYPEWLFSAPSVSTLHGTSAIPLAEYAMLAMLAVAKHVPDVWIRSREEWRQWPLDCLFGQTLGIVGLGGIGRAVADRALAFGMRVKALRHSGGAMPPGIERAGDLGSLIAEADHLLLSAPGTPETRHMIDAAMLARAKMGLHLINLGRGSLIDDDALLAALDSGKVAMATLDVAAVEPPPADHPFYSHPRIRFSPHTAAYTQLTFDTLIAQMQENIGRFLATGTGRERAGA